MSRPVVPPPRPDRVALPGWRQCILHHINETNPKFTLWRLRGGNVDAFGRAPQAVHADVQEISAIARFKRFFSCPYNT
jgi:hypothetical protein